VRTEIRIAYTIESAESVEPFATDDLHHSLPLHLAWSVARGQRFPGVRRWRRGVFASLMVGIREGERRVGDGGFVRFIVGYCFGVWNLSGDRARGRRGQTDCGDVGAWVMFCVTQLGGTVG
jgi:hypothetical protein